MKSGLISRVLRLSLFAAGICAVHAPSTRADSLIYQSATANDSPAGGATVDSSFYIGARFQVTSAETATEIGGSFRNFNATNSIFGALVQLSGPTDFPNYPLTSSSPGVLAYATITVPVTGGYADYVASLDRTPTLAVGTEYALVFGADAGGGAAASTNNHPTAGVSYFDRSTGSYADETSSDYRLFLNGTAAAAAAPLPQTLWAGLAMLGGCGLISLRRRFRSNNWHAETL